MKTMFCRNYDGIYPKFVLAFFINLLFNSNYK